MFIDGEPNNVWFKQALCYSAVNDVELWDHVQDLYPLVGGGS